LVEISASTAPNSKLSTAIEAVYAVGGAGVVAVPWKGLESSRNGSRGSSRSSTAVEETVPVFGDISGNTSASFNPRAGMETVYLVDGAGVGDVPWSRSEASIKGSRSSRRAALAVEYTRAPY